MHDSKRLFNVGILCIVVFISLDILNQIGLFKAYLWRVNRRMIGLYFLSPCMIYLHIFYLSAIWNLRVKRYFCWFQWVKITYDVLIVRNLSRKILRSMDSQFTYLQGKVKHHILSFLETREVFNLILEQSKTSLKSLRQ